MEVRGKIGDSKEHDIELMGRIQEELAHQDEGIKHQVHNVSSQVSQLETLFKNHSQIFSKYDAMVEGQNQMTKDMAADLEAMLKRTVSQDVHRRDLSELEGNMRTLIYKLESKITSQEDTVKKMEE